MEQYTEAQSQDATACETVVLSLRTLQEAFKAVPDPRRKQGRRYDLAALVTLTVAGLVCNQNSVLAIAQWAADQPAMIKIALGFPKQVTPNHSTLHRLFRRLDPDALGTALTRYFDPPPCATETQQEAEARRARGSQGVALDGKALRGMLHSQGNPDRQNYALNAVCHDLGITLAQMAIASKEAELTVAPTLIGSLDWQGRVLTGDALFCQRTLCTQVVAAHGDYLLVIKDNQARMLEEITTLFSAITERVTPTSTPVQPWLAPPPLEYDEATTGESGHGRINDTRRVRVSAELAGHTDWPHLAHVFEFHRTWEQAGVRHGETWYGVTSLPCQVADAKRILDLKRGHWMIENGLHRVKDVTFGEDASLLHTEAGPHIMAALRNTAVSLLRRAGHDQLAAARRMYSRKPRQALHLLGIQLR